MAADLEKHSRVGEYRDATEYRLKTQLGKLIGLKNDEEHPDEDTHHAHLGVTESTLFRREQIQRHFEELVNMIDTDGNGLLDSDEVQEAYEKNPEFRDKMEVVAFNLALDPENRIVSDSSELNAEIQAEVEEVIRLTDADGDGFITREEIDLMPPKCRDTLSKLGLPAVLGKVALMAGHK